MRLGEALVKKGLITEEQLQESLKAQLIYGGHLGTCLIELGYIKEGDLGQMLAEIFKVGYASVEMIQDIPGNVIQTVPRKVVERCHAIPFGLNEKKLQVAMIDPRNIVAIDEISAVTACKITPWVAPEARIFQAMERYYDIPRRQRYITVCRDLDRGPLGVAEDPRLRYATGNPPWQASLADFSSDDSAQSRGGPAAPPDDDPGIEPVHDLGGVSKRLCAAEKLDSVADTLLAFASRQMARCIFFVVKGSKATVWASRGISERKAEGAGPTFPVGPDTIFGLTLGRGDYRGPVPDDPRFRSFYEELKLDLPSEILILPLYLDDRLVAVFYGDGGAGASLDVDDEEYRRLAQMVTLSMNLVVIKKKILAA